MFYVYEWYNVDTGEVIYVGKGCRNRYKVRKHNRLFDVEIRTNNCASRIIKRFDNEADAFRYELEYIAERQAHGECKCNIYPGGQGGTFKCWTEDRRRQYSEYNVMKSQKQRDRMHLKNPMMNEQVAARVGATKRKAIVVGTYKFESLSAAMRQYGPSVAYWVTVGHTNTYEPCYYECEGPKEFERKRNLGGAKPVVYNGKVYECAKDICLEFGFKPSTLSKYIRRGYTDTGIECRKLDAQAVQEYTKYDGCRPVIIDGIRYDSLKLAAQSTGLYPQGIRYAIRHSGVYKGHKCEYANQQPSLVKSEYSSKEGSTTNE